MFKCGLCHENSKVGEKAFSVVIEERWAYYPVVKNAHTFKARDGRDMVRDDMGGEGLQIVKEVLAHQKCAQKRGETKTTNQERIEHVNVTTYQC